MRTAIVHDYLSQRGGAERVVLALARTFPGAPIYTSIYFRDRTYPEFADLDVRTSSLQRSVRPDHFRRAVLRLPGRFGEFDLSGYDCVVVSSSAFAHHVRHRRALVYCHTPPHFLYDTAAYLGRRSAAAAVWPLLELLRRSDQRAAAAAAGYVANSCQTARRILEVYGREAPVVYPPLWTDHLPAVPPPLPAVPRALVVARLLPYKRIDVAIGACRRLGLGLTIVGEGPHEAKLRALATGDVDFLGRISDDELAELFARHSVVLAPGLEDFGYGPVEANYAGRPVVALAGGGALETVVDGENGALVQGWSEDRWAEALSAVLARTWAPDELRASTRPFHADRFEASLRSWVAGGG